MEREATEQKQFAPHQKRVINERNELKEKADRLSQFWGTEIYNGLSVNEKNLLHMQLRVMDQYIAILEMRIATF